jgi:hypothetical protein
MKGRIAGQWEMYIASHIRQNQIGLPTKEWAVKLIIVLHEDNQRRIARYKVEVPLEDWGSVEQIQHATEAHGHNITGTLPTTGYYQ